MFGTKPSPYVQGRTAAKRGFGLIDNPYTHGTPEYKLWRNGWFG